MIPHNYTPLHLPHHLESAHKKGISPVWFGVILVLILLQGIFVYLFFSGRIGGVEQNNVKQETLMPTAIPSSTPDIEATTSSQSATPSTPTEVEFELDELERELEATPAVTPAPDIPTDF